MTTRTVASRLLAQRQAFRLAAAADPTLASDAAYLLCAATNEVLSRPLRASVALAREAEEVVYRGAPAEAVALVERVVWARAGVGSWAAFSLLTGERRFLATYSAIAFLAWHAPLAEGWGPEVVAIEEDFWTEAQATALALAA